METEKDRYERELAEKQAQHLLTVNMGQDANWQPCMHDACPECVGTGVKHDGSVCMHMMSCPCPKCSPQY